MASLDDILTAAKNIVVALNGGNAVAKTAFAQSSSLNASTTTQVSATSGRLYAVIVTTSGSSLGNLYDSATITGIGASNLIATIPATVAVNTFNWPFQNGLVFVPGTGMVANISYA